MDSKKISIEVDGGTQFSFNYGEVVSAEQLRKELGSAADHLEPGMYKVGYCGSSTEEMAEQDFVDLIDLEKID